MVKARLRGLFGVCVLLAACAMAAHLTACHTVKGFGRDIEAMGQGGQDLIDGKK